jgi:solute carrier family 38 (sodium-coupled neutral amino acid transporter), member 10
MELLGFHMFGSLGKTIVELGTIGFLAGSMVTFYVVIGDLSPLIVSKVFNIQGYNYDTVRQFLIIIITLTCIIPLSFQKSIESLSFVCQASIGKLLS